MVGLRGVRTGSQLNNFPFLRYDGVTETEAIGASGGAAGISEAISASREQGSRVGECSYR